jgi:death-on-curing protein
MSGDREPFWLDESALRLVHDEVVSGTGGVLGVRDAGLLESALMRPRNAFSYGERDVFVLAALYAEGVAKNHPFADGNKRAAFLAAVGFLEINGFVLMADQNDAAAHMIALAASQIDSAAFSAWLRANVKPTS